MENSASSLIGKTKRVNGNKLSKFF